MINKPHNNGTWTKARKNSFITSALRGALMRWGPKSRCISNARVERGRYRCEHCKEIGPATLPALEGNKRRRKNIVADHINPIVDPSTGFIDWNDWIAKAFVEINGLQALCWQCHTNKTNDERAVAKARRDREKSEKKIREEK